MVREPGQVTASAENAQVTVLQANRENGLKAQIFVTAKDTGAVQTYVVQFKKKVHRSSVWWRLPEGQELKEDQTVPLEVIAYYQDGSQQVSKSRSNRCRQELVAKEKPSQPIKVWNCGEAGLVHFKANFQGQTGRSRLYHHAKSRRKDSCEGASYTD